MPVIDQSMTSMENVVMNVMARAGEDFGTGLQRVLKDGIMKNFKESNEAVELKYNVAGYELISQDGIPGGAVNTLEEAPVLRALGTYLFNEQEPYRLRMGSVGGESYLKVVYWNTDNLNAKEINAGTRMVGAYAPSYEVLVEAKDPSKKGSSRTFNISFRERAGEKQYFYWCMVEYGTQGSGSYGVKTYDTVNGEKIQIMTTQADGVPIRYFRKRQPMYWVGLNAEKYIKELCTRLDKVDVAAKVSGRYMIKVDGSIFEGLPKPPAVRNKTLGLKMREEVSGKGGI